MFELDDPRTLQIALGKLSIQAQAEAWMFKLDDPRTLQIALGKPGRSEDQNETLPRWVRRALIKSGRLGLSAEPFAVAARVFIPIGMAPPSCVCSKVTVDGGLFHLDTR
jgi:hypothetical protein